MKKFLSLVILFIAGSWVLNAQSFPFKQGTRFNCRSEYGKTNNFYIVTSSTKTARNCFTFEMEDRGDMRVNDTPSLDGYVIGTWDNGNVVLKRLDRNKKAYDILSFKWNGSFFKTFFGDYTEQDGAPQQSIKITNLPDDYLIFVDGCQYQKQGATRYVSVAKGVHEIKICAPGYNNYNVVADTRNCKSENYVIEYPSKKGKMSSMVYFNNVPPMSVIYVDGKKDKNAVLSSQLTINNQTLYFLSSEYPSGSHTYKIVSPGFKESTGTFNIGDGYSSLSMSPEFIPDTVEKTLLYIYTTSISPDDFYITINDILIDDFADAYLNANQNNTLAVYSKKDSSMIYVENIFANKYIINLTDYARCPHWFHKVRGVPENTDIFFTNTWNEYSGTFAKMGDCYYYAQETGGGYVPCNIKAVQKEKVIFDANFLVCPDSIGNLADIVIDKSLVKDKWVIGDLFPGDDGKPIGIVVSTNSSGEHGTILSLEEFKYYYVLSDGKRQYGTIHAALEAFAGEETKYPKLASFDGFFNHLRGGYLSGDATDKEVYAAIKKYFPAFYNADKYEIGSYNQWYLPNNNDLTKVLNMADFINQKLRAAELAPLLDFENHGYMTIQAIVVVGNSDDSDNVERNTRFMTDF